MAGSIRWQNRTGPQMAMCWAEFRRNLLGVMGEVAKDMENFGKQNHPWTNRTGQAEREFTAQVRGTRIYVANAAPHGIFLEFKDGGRWGVVPATIEYGARQFTGKANRAFVEAFG